MKVLLFSFLIFSAHASDTFEQRLGQFLNKKYSSFISKASSKLNVSRDNLGEKVKHQLNKDSLSFSGEIETDYGLCKLEGTLSFIDQNTSVKCITKDLKAKIIFI